VRRRGSLSAVLPDLARARSLVWVKADRTPLPSRERVRERGRAAFAGIEAHKAPFLRASCAPSPLPSPARGEGAFGRRAFAGFCRAGAGWVRQRAPYGHEGIAAQSPPLPSRERACPRASTRGVGKRRRAFIAGMAAHHAPFLRASCAPSPLPSPTRGEGDFGRRAFAGFCRAGAGWVRQRASYDREGIAAQSPPLPSRERVRERGRAAFAGIEAHNAPFLRDWRASSPLPPGSKPGGKPSPARGEGASGGVVFP
jgi:hypothetical protein